MLRLQLCFDSAKNRRKGEEGSYMEKKLKKDKEARKMGKVSFRVNVCWRVFQKKKGKDDTWKNNVCFYSPIIKLTCYSCPLPPDSIEVKYQ